MNPLLGATSVPIFHSLPYFGIRDLLCLNLLQKTSILPRTFETLACQGKYCETNLVFQVANFKLKYLAFYFHDLSSLNGESLIYGASIYDAQQIVISWHVLHNHCPLNIPGFEVNHRTPTVSQSSGRNI